MRRIGVTAALLLAGVAIAAAGRAAPAHALHTCSATDRAFLRAAASGLETVQLMGESYIAGDGSAASVVSAARTASLAVDRTSPRDVSLERARVLVRGMFTEYGRAVGASERGADPLRHMYRAYSLANYAHAELELARPGLALAGCRISPLL